MKSPLQRAVPSPTFWEGAFPRLNLSLLSTQTATDKDYENVSRSILLPPACPELSCPCYFSIADIRKANDVILHCKIQIFCQCMTSACSSTAPHMLNCRDFAAHITNKQRLWIIQQLPFTLEMLTYVLARALARGSIVSIQYFGMREPHRTSSQGATA